MKFWSKRAYSLGAILWGLPVANLLLLVLFFLWQNKGFFFNKNQLVALVVLLILTAVLFYLWYNTFYVIENGQMKYRVGFFSGAINIFDIYAIRKSDYLMTGNRPTMALKGLLLYYGDNRTIYISPENETAFVNELRKINSAITFN